MSDPIGYDGRSMPDEIPWEDVKPIGTSVEHFYLMPVEDFGFLVIVESKSEHTISLRVERINGMDSDLEGPGKAFPEDRELYLKGFIKWDSCCHFNFGQEDGYIHLCGVESLKQHCWLIEQLYKLAFKLMGRDPDPEDVW